MNRAVKIILYVVLLTAATVLGARFYHAYQEVNQHESTRFKDETDPNDRVAATNLPSVTNILVASNTVEGSNAVALTNAVEGTNVAANSLVGDTNAVAAEGEGQTNGTNQASATSSKGTKAKRSRTPLVRPSGQVPEPITVSGMMTYGVCLFIVVVCLSLLFAHDFSHLVAERTYNFVLDENGTEVKGEEYDRAEQVAVDGRHLEAIQLMRDYLKKHPRELYVSIRIAEIYEKELGNYLAAALEIEEVLKHRLRPEQWGSNAIHLANLYSGKLNQTEKAVALLRRINSEYGGTAAALKARTRLARLEGEPVGEVAMEEEAPVVKVAPAPESTSASNLPKGFRPKG